MSEAHAASASDRSRGISATHMTAVLETLKTVNFLDPAQRKISTSDRRQSTIMELPRAGQIAKKYSNDEKEMVLRLIDGWHTMRSHSYEPPASENEAFNLQIRPDLATITTALGEANLAADGAAKAGKAAFNSTSMAAAFNLMVLKDAFASQEDLFSKWHQGQKSANNVRSSSLASKAPEVKREFAISGSLLGSSMILFSVGMSIPTFFSGFYLLHPAIAIALVITGLTFLAMSSIDG